MAVEINFSKASLLEALGERLALERDLFQECLVMKHPESSNDVGPLERDRAVRWLWRTHEELGLHADTFILSVTLIDRLLNKVKINLKYLRCAALTAYWIAAKMTEEPEKVPTALQLIKTTHGKFGPQDMAKMEHLILKKLEWKITQPTPYDFLNLFVAVLWQNPDDAAVEHLSASHMMECVVAQLQECLCSSMFLKFKGSVLVLALISCVLESAAVSWFQTISWIQKHSGITTMDLLSARQAFESVSRSGKAARPLSINLRGLAKVEGPLSPIQENPFEMEFAAAQFQQRGGACALPSGSHRASSPTKRLVQDDSGFDRHSYHDAMMDTDGFQWPRPALKKVKRSFFAGSD